jgi:formate hydrogenlyase transcriptional activator
MKGTIMTTTVDDAPARPETDLPCECSGPSVIEGKNEVTFLNHTHIYGHSQTTDMPPLDQAVLQLFSELVLGTTALEEFQVLRVWFCEPGNLSNGPHLLNSGLPPKVRAGMELPLDDAIVGWVWQHQRPLMIAAETETRFRDFAMHLLELGIKYFCAVPLMLANRRIGILGLASNSPDAISRFELDFVRRGASSSAKRVDRGQEIQKSSRGEPVCSVEELTCGDSFQGIVGRSLPMSCLGKQISVVAPTDSTVLILGETGTGKELIGQAIHNLSSRNRGPFVKVNCAAIPAGLIESELFGHERGAFTGALGRRIGRFEMAHGGTLLLDEIGDIPLELQPKLLRVLQEQKFERVGGSQTTQVNVRIVAATSRDLPQMVASKEFRADLYYRLNVFPLNVPALRDRAEDIPLLVKYFVGIHGKQMGKSIKDIPVEIMDAFLRYSWPGNIRELQNAIERAVILSPGEVLCLPVADLKPSSSMPDARGLGNYDRMTLKEMEREHILQALAATNWVLGGPKGAGAMLGLVRTTLIGKMRKLGISRTQV